MKLSYHLLFVPVLPAFFVLFCCIYNPFSIKDFYEVGGKGYLFHFLMLAAIILIIAAIIRPILSVLIKLVPFKPLHHVLWCFGEVLLMSLFCAMYTSLFYAGDLPYFSALPKCLEFLALSLVYPYVILVLIGELYVSNVSVESSESMSLLNFRDAKGRLKLSLSPSELLYIKAEANYVRIYYHEQEELREFLLRNSMKNLETLALQSGLQRCHRSYYVNPACICNLTRNKDGSFSAEVAKVRGETVPVSRRYYESLSKLIASNP